MVTNLETQKSPDWKEKISGDLKTMKNDLIEKKDLLDGKVDAEVKSSFSKFSELSDFEKDGNPSLKTMGSGQLYRLDSYGEECEIDVTNGKVRFIKSGGVVDLNLDLPGNIRSYNNYEKNPEQNAEDFRFTILWMLKRANLINKAVSISKKHPGESFYFEDGNFLERDSELHKERFLKIGGEKVISLQGLDKTGFVSSPNLDKGITREIANEELEAELLSNLNKIVS